MLERGNVTMREREGEGKRGMTVKGREKTKEGKR